MTLMGQGAESDLLPWRHSLWGAGWSSRLQNGQVTLREEQLKAWRVALSRCGGSLDLSLLFNHSAGDPSASGSGQAQVPSGFKAQDTL